MFEDKCVWSALYPISNHSHIRQLQFATHAFSQQVLQQAVQISICQWRKYENTKAKYEKFIVGSQPMRMREYTAMNNNTVLLALMKIRAYGLKALQ